MNQGERIRNFTETMWAWFARHKRVLPWRDLDIADDTQRAYQILVSEIMLQQTQVHRVIIAYRNFLDRFPTINHLANASNKDVIMAWRGMGYNSRALRLRDAAKTIVEKHQGVFPSNYDQLLSIKGIGPYTAGAIRNFAFNLPTVCADVNIERIVRRVFVGGVTRVPRGKRVTATLHSPFSTLNLSPMTSNVLRIALDHPQSKTSDWHAALMDFGSAICTKRKPKCEQCPMNGFCKSAFKAEKLESHIVKKAEPMHRGIPQRIYRGKVIEALRDASQPLSIDTIGQEIFLGYETSDTIFLQKVIKKLSDESFIEISKGKYILKN